MEEYLLELISPEELIIGDCKISTSEDGILIKIEYDETKQLIKQFKSNLEKLEDCLFVEIAEDIENYFSLKEFSDLLEKDSFTNEERVEIKNKIHIVSNIVKEHIVNSIKSLEDRYKDWDI